MEMLFRVCKFCIYDTSGHADRLSNIAYSAVKSVKECKVGRGGVCGAKRMPVTYSTN